jgi:hypothetical protein
MLRKLFEAAMCRFRSVRRIAEAAMRPPLTSSFHAAASSTLILDGVCSVIQVEANAYGQILPTRRIIFAFLIRREIILRDHIIQ